MTKFKVLVSEAARRRLYEIPDEISTRIKSALGELADNPFRARPKADIKKLQGPRNPELFRLRVGDFRAIYSVEGNTIKVSLIIKRGEGYDRID